MQCGFVVERNASLFWRNRQRKKGFTCFGWPRRLIACAKYGNSRGCSVSHVCACMCLHVCMYCMCICASCCLGTTWNFLHDTGSPLQLTACLSACIYTCMTQERPRLMPVAYLPPSTPLHIGLSRREAWVTHQLLSIHNILDHA